MPNFFMVSISISQTAKTDRFLSIKLIGRSGFLSKFLGNQQGEGFYMQFPLKTWLNIIVPNKNHCNNSFLSMKLIGRCLFLSNFLGNQQGEGFLYAVST